MSQSWTAARPHSFREACLDWSRLIGRRRDMLDPARPDRGQDYAPILVHLLTGEDPVAARTALRGLVQDTASPLLMDTGEAQMLDARIDRPQDLAALPDDYMLYRRIGTPDGDHANLFTVLDSGMPVQMTQAGPLPKPPGPVPPTPRPGAPIVTIVDDGIGFLNARFCRDIGPGGKESRFHALWLMATEQQDPNPVGTVAGRVLARAALDTLIAQGDERGAYAALNGALYSDESRAETAYATTHGTHVLDLAAGADPDDATDPVRDWPLLGVQLPPGAIDDTSGTWFESYLVMAVRWILRQARRVDPTAPVILNLSLGVLAGPKDGTRFAEYQVAREAREWERATGQPVRVVWAFGNSYRSSQVARLAFARKTATPRTLAWRVQPDDETASYVEIHTRKRGSDVLQIGLTTPDGMASGLAEMAPGEIRTLERPDGAALARIYHVPERRYDAQTLAPAHYVLALAPTRGQKAAEPQAGAGVWEIAIRCAAKAEVLVQVQRDDAIRGSAVRGRQSYLDHPTAYAWEARRAAYVSPDPDGPITDAGCHNALVSAQGRQIFCVGAARIAGHAPRDTAGAFGPASYTGQGSHWSVPGPTVATVLGLGAFYGGVRAAGTLTGSTRRLSGTSAAAGRLTRALALSAARILRNTALLESTQIDDLDPDVVGLLKTGTVDPRLGQAIIILPETLPAC